MTDAKTLNRRLPDTHSKLLLTREDREEVYRITNCITGVFRLQLPSSPMCVYFDEIVPQDYGDTAMLVRNGEITARLPNLSEYVLSKEKLRYWE